MNHSRVTSVGGTVDADRTWRRLADGYDIREFIDCHPMMLVHDFVLNERQHRIATSKVEDAYLREDVKQF